MKRTRTTPKPNLIIAQGQGWHVEFDRCSKDYAAMIDGVGVIGYAAKPHEAQTLINDYRANQYKQAA